MWIFVRMANYSIGAPSRELGLKVREDTISGLQKILGVEPIKPNPNGEKAVFESKVGRVQVYTLQSTDSGPDSGHRFEINARQVKNSGFISEFLENITDRYLGAVRFEYR